MATFYSQNDKRWKDIPVRNGLTIGISGDNKPVGCLLDVLAYVFSVIGGLDITPDVVLAYAKSHSLIDNNGYLNWKIVELFTEGKVKYYPTDPGRAKFIITEVRFGDQHFVGYRKSDHTITDPWDGKRKAANPYFAKYPVISWRYIK